MKIHFLLLFICSFSIINTQDVIPFQEEEGVLWGLKNGDDIIIEASYHYINDFHEGLAEVKMDNQRGFINKKGEIIVPIDYANDFKDSVAWVYIDHIIGLIDHKGNELTEIKYQDGQKKFYDGMAIVSEKKLKTVCILRINS
ncbi:MAG: hypothetical protein ACI94Y_002740 [Maribacter sp.]|jgi:hypothetical protein